MDIYIMRHGQAEMMASCDSERALTDNGTEQSKKMARYLADKKKVEFDAALVSPYLRAQQTFAAISPFFSKRSNVQRFNALTPSGSVNKSVNEIMALQAAGVQTLLIISHLPLVGYIVAALDPTAGAASFTTSAVAHVEFDDQGFGKLLSMTAPSDLN